VPLTGVFSRRCPEVIQTGDVPDMHRCQPSRIPRSGIGRSPCRTAFFSWCRFSANPVLDRDRIEDIHLDRLPDPDGHGVRRQALSGNGEGRQWNRLPWVDRWDLSRHPFYAHYADTPVEQPVTT